MPLLDAIREVQEEIAAATGLSAKDSGRIRNAMEWMATPRAT